MSPRFWILALVDDFKSEAEQVHRKVVELQIKIKLLQYTAGVRWLKKNSVMTVEGPSQWVLAQGLSVFKKIKYYNIPIKVSKVNYFTTINQYLLWWISQESNEQN